MRCVQDRNSWTSPGGGKGQPRPGPRPRVPGSRDTCDVPRLWDVAVDHPGGCPRGSDSELKPRAFQRQKEPYLGHIPPAVLGSLSIVKTGLGHHWAQGPASGSHHSPLKNSRPLPNTTTPSAPWVKHTPLTSVSLLQVPPEVGVAPDSPGFTRP